MNVSRSVGAVLFIGLGVWISPTRLAAQDGPVLPGLDELPPHPARVVPRSESTPTARRVAPPSERPRPRSSTSRPNWNRPPSERPLPVAPQGRAVVGQRRPPMPSTAARPARNPATTRPAWNNRGGVQSPAQRPVDPRNRSAYARSRYATARPQQPATQPAQRRTTPARRPVVIQSTPTGRTARGTGGSPAVSQSRASQIFGASNSPGNRPAAQMGNASRGSSAGRSRR